MVCFALRLADVLIDVTVQHDYARNFCNDWITDSSESTDSRLTITVTQDDIDSERAEACKEYAKGRPRVAAPDTYGDDYLEILSLYRKIAEALTARNILLFHGSAVDDQTYVSITDGRNTSILSWFPSLIISEAIPSSLPTETATTTFSLLMTFEIYIFKFLDMTDSSQIFNE